MNNTFKDRYYQFFSIQEIEQSFILQLLFYVISLSFFVSFYGWFLGSAVSMKSFFTGVHVCPPYFLNCGEYYFIQNLPYGYSQGIFYMGLFMLLVYGIRSAINKEWVSAHMAILICLLWKIIWGFVLTYGLIGNFDYYDMSLAIVWLFFSNKEYFAKITFVWLYFLASTVKIHDGWILANYFNALYTGAPIFGFSNLQFFTNLVIVMQILGAWFLFSKNRYLYWTAFCYFLLFHIYSGIIVQYRYITISIPALLVLFGATRVFGQPTNQDFKMLPLGKKTFAGYLFLLFLLLGQMTAVMIPGDQRKTLEGNYSGLYMFEAAHQCLSTTTILFTNGEKKVLEKENKVANLRCDPYVYFFRLKNICQHGKYENKNIDSIAWQFDHSINGHKFERIVDTPNLCALEYHAFTHNDWIRLNPEILETPVHKEGYLSPLEENTKVLSNPVQNQAMLDFLTEFYWSLWTFVLLTLFLAVIYQTIRPK